MTYPLTGQVVFDTVSVTVEASDNKGIAFVEFYVDGELLSTDNAAPYRFDWDTDPYADGGTHSIYAKAYDLAGNSTTTAITTVTVSNKNSSDVTPPIVLVLYPVSGSTVSGTVNVVADVSDNIAIDYVEFYIDGILKETDTDGTDYWSYNWDTASYADDESHTIFIKAYDTSGNVGQSALIDVIVPTP
jgi:hypothetical protein